MERNSIQVKGGWEYDHYFPRAKGGSHTKKRGATVADTIVFIPKVVRSSHWQARRFAHEVIKADTLIQTCKNIYDFCFQYIAYKKDEAGTEQIRTFARTWRDRHNFNSKGEPSGVDCDCYATFISCILFVLKVPHTFRITKNDQAYFQHIYVIVPIGNGHYITLDPVVTKFNIEAPFYEKYDKIMDLQLLDGVEGFDPYQKPNAFNNTLHSQADFNPDLNGLDAISDDEAVMGLGRLFKRKSSSNSNEEKKTFGQKLVKGINAVNKFNPATALVRAGVLVSMKINMLKIPSELKYTYLSNEAAQNAGVDMGKFSRMKNVREKLEDLFFIAGGNKDNLKKSILTGKGNRGGEVALSGYENDLDRANNHLNGLNAIGANTKISDVIGADILKDEGINGYDGYHSEANINGLGQLAEPATGTAIAAAGSILTVIAGMIKTIGSIVPKKHQKAVDDNENENTTSDNSSEKQINESSPSSNTDSKENEAKQQSENSIQNPIQNPIQNSIQNIGEKIKTYTPNLNQKLYLLARINLQLIIDKLP
jgi:hypothetical protein